MSTFRFTAFTFVKKALTLLTVLFCSQVFSQALIINEVSNGPSGNKEYVEFVVTDTGAIYNCGATTPPCIDIRGWIFDDNSGYHGSGGIATGAIRFSYNTLWQCVPVGTIILIYNDADPNAGIPPVDLSLTDGNCRIVAPISSALFETNLTTPGAVACSYPATGWTSGGNWNTTLLANPGDCARLVNLSGCEVFSVCWATDNLNTLIYFNSGGSGTDNVWYFNSGDPNNQANWTEGCADPSACGTDDQTPGLPNNAANAAFIAQFNNGCSTITPISSSITSFTNAGCSCDGTATVTASGSIPGYTYAWYDVFMNPIMQTGATATGLCPGTYNVITQSSIGCSDTASVLIGSTGGSTLAVSIVAPNDTTCATGGPFTLLGSPAGGYWLGTGVTPWGEFAGVVSGPGTFTLTYTATAGGCTGSASIDITVLPVNALYITPVLTACVNDAPIQFTATPPGGFFYGSTPLTIDGLFDPGYGPGTYTIGYQIDLPGSCSLWDSTTIVVTESTVNMTAVPPVCEDVPAFNLTATPAGGTWSGTGIINTTLGTFSPSAAGPGVHTITYTAGSGSCTGSGTINVTVNPGVTVNIDPVAPVCETVTPFALNASPAGGTWSGAGVSAAGIFSPATAGSGSHWVYYTLSTTGPCGGLDSVLISVNTIDALFTPDPVTGHPPLQVTLTNNSFGSSSYYWWVNDTVYAVDADTTITYDTAGYYQVTLYVVSPGGCMDSLTQTIYVYDEFALTVPNIFTPNSDGYNDAFSIDVLGVHTLEAVIFNRWGQHIHAFASETVSNGKVEVWDGRTKNGDHVSDGVYAFVLKARAYTGQEQVLNGFVTVVRSK